MGRTREVPDYFETLELNGCEQCLAYEIYFGGLVEPGEPLFLPYLDQC